MNDEQRLPFEPWHKLPSEIQLDETTQRILNPGQYWEAEAQRYREALIAIQRICFTGNWGADEQGLRTTLLQIHDVVQDALPPSRE